jgi:Family of unknown function (DUF5683)
MKKLYQATCILVFLCMSIPALNGQVQGDDQLPEETISSPVQVDTTDLSAPKEKKGSIFAGKPGKAMMLSLILPGTGQIYNKSYLRVPFVYAAVGGMGYLVYYNTRVYNCRKEAYMASIDGVAPQFPEYCADCDPGLETITNPSTLRILRDDANNARQLSIVGLTLVWILNGVDAFVDAHLKDFDIDENLSLEIGTKFDNDLNSPMRMGVFVQF